MHCLANDWLGAGEALLDNSAEVNHFSDSTALGFACENGNPAFVKLLLQRKAKVRLHRRGRRCFVHVLFLVSTPMFCPCFSDRDVSCMSCVVSTPCFVRGCRCFVHLVCCVYAHALYVGAQVWFVCRRMFCPTGLASDF